MKLRFALPRVPLLSLLVLALVLSPGLATRAASIATSQVTLQKHSSRVRGSHTVRHRLVAVRHTRRTSRRVRSASHAHRRTARRYRRRHRVYERFTASSYSQNQTVGDITAGEDPVVRQAAISALGDLNGTIVVIDPNNGRILAMVNQKMALSSGAEPCSTIKLSVALAALQEGIVTQNTPVDLGGRYHMTLTEALAHSNNLYFETIGRRLGFERVKHYANMLGLGELAGYDIPGEHLGVYPNHVLPASKGGVGRMCSFGESISVTPLQLGALISAIANGGTLYYLQHPESAAQVADFQPRVKRELNIGPLLPAMSVGMTDVVKFGTGRTVLANFKEFPVLGKTGTCSNHGTRFGWFGSYADTPHGRLVTVILLEGGRAVFGPKAAELAGVFYHNLEEQNYYATMNHGQPRQEISSLSEK